MNRNLLSAKKMAQFVASGYLRLECMVPKDLCAAGLEEMADYRGYHDVGTPFEETWPTDTALGQAFRLPKVQGLIRSLVGPNPIYNHHGPHITPTCPLRGPDTHQDSVIDFREDYFDI